jgi:LysR family glycine cleavage system transcriptional activator
MNRLPLTALRAFEAVASHLSFGAAATALYVSPAAVSQQVRALESRLGYPLFERLGSSIRLTAEGARLLPRVRRGFDELRRAMDEALRRQDARQLNVSLLASFLQRWLLPRLPGFQQAHPDIDLRLSASNQMVDLAGSDFHLAIRYGAGRWPGVRAQRLLDDWLLPVCSAEWLARHGPIRGTADLGRHKLLQANTEPWQEWIKASFGRRHEVQIHSELDDSTAVVIAAERGYGLALARWSLVSTEVQSGRLVCAADWAAHHFRAYYLVSTAARMQLPAVRSFADWLLAAARASAPPPLKLRRKPRPEPA